MKHFIPLFSFLDLFIVCSIRVFGQMISLQMTCQCFPGNLSSIKQKKQVEMFFFLLVSITRGLIFAMFNGYEDACIKSISNP